MIEVSITDKRDYSKLLDPGDEVEKGYHIDTKEIVIYQETEFGYRITIKMTHKDAKELSEVVDAYLKNLEIKRQKRIEKRKSSI